LNAQIIPGANQIITCKEYLQQLEKLHKKENDLQFLKTQEVSYSKEDKHVADDDDDIGEDDTQSDTYAINM
jgi:hypothetical protein